MKAILIGYGKMGRMVEDSLKELGWEILGVVDPEMFRSPLDVPGKPDAIVDFSYPGNLENAVKAARMYGCALVEGTTGLSEAQLAMVREAAADCPVIQSYNFSQGVAAIRKAARLLAEALMPGFDCEIVEAHHHFKEDAPSGTAKMLLAAVDPAGEYEVVNGRSGRPGARGHEIGVHALRGGTDPGEHQVLFFGEDEIVEIRHSAISRRIFARGAARATDYLVGKPNGMYTMDDVLGE